MFTRSLISALAIVSLAACSNVPTEPFVAPAKIATICDGIGEPITYAPRASNPTVYRVQWCTPVNTVSVRTLVFPASVGPVALTAARNYLECEMSYPFRADNDYCATKLPVGTVIE